MIKEALQYVAEQLAQPEAFNDGRIDADGYVSRELFLPPPEPTAEPVWVSTLSGVVGYLEKNRDGLDRSTLLTSVVEPDVVHLLGPLHSRHRLREVTLKARAELPTFSFGSFMDLESFNIAVQSVFLDDGDRGAVLGITSKVGGGSVLETEDDGISQRVTVKRGLELMEERKIPNPVTLRPYRTFVEVDQPASQFVLRLREGARGGIEAGLFEADGGAWRRTALQAVGEHLKKALKSSGAGDVEVVW